LQDASEYVELALELGFSHIDTSQAYANEESVGKAIRESGLSRSDFFVTTKWSAPNVSVRQSLSKSLSKLGLDHVDLYLIDHAHYFLIGHSVWQEVEKFKGEGLVKSIGVSNFDLDNLKTLAYKARIPPAVNQIELHPYNYHKNKELLQFAKEKGIVIEAYGTLSPITKWPGGPVDGPVNEAAKRLGATPTQVLLSWVRSKGAVIVTTSATENHLREYLETDNLPVLMDAELAAIDAAGAKGHPTTFVERWHLKTIWSIVWFLITVAMISFTIYLMRRRGWF